MSLAIINGHLIDPAAGISAQKDLLIENGTVQAVGSGFDADETIDAAGCIVAPGFVDLHVHFREPGFESKETIETGSRAAAKGGVTTVVTMANTKPPIDNAGMVDLVIRRARETSCIKVRPAACATKGMDGKEITEMAELRDLGAVAITDDGKDVADSALMRRILQYASMVGLPVMCHCEEESLAEGGSMNEGFTSTQLGLPAIPKAAEEIRIDRNIRLAAMTGAHVHIQHITSAEGVDIVRRAKEKGWHVTAETCPHYWMLTDEAVKAYDTNAKMNPPLREETDRLAIIEGIKDGTIDCLATDHAPHTPTEKGVSFQNAPFGIIGLETLLSLVVTGLVEPGHITLERAIEMMTFQPSAICSLDAGCLREGHAADIVIFDPTATWTVDENGFASRGKNSPFIGQTLTGQVKYTLCDGEVVYSLG